MRDSRQITVLRSLFKTLHPLLKSGIETGLAPARRMLTTSQEQAARESAEDDSTARPSSEAAPNQATAKETANRSRAPARATIRKDEVLSRAPKPLPPLPKTLTDEHLVAELENVTRQYEVADRATPSPQPGKPRRSNRHISRDTLLSLLEEAKVRIQVLETELELARGTEELIPLLTEEWSDDLPSTMSRKPD